MKKTFLFFVLIFVGFSLGYFAGNSGSLNDESKQRIESISQADKSKLSSVRVYYEKVALDYSIAPGVAWKYPEMPDRKIREALVCIELAGTVLLQVQGKSGEQTIEVGCLFSK